MRRHGIPFKIKKQLKEQSGNKCNMCGSHFSSEILEIAHIVPLSKGGESNLENLVVLCPICHKQLDSQLFREFDFVNYLMNLMKESKQFSEIYSESIIDNNSCLRADISALEQINGSWSPIIIEAKSYTSFPPNMASEISSQIQRYRDILPDSSFIFSFPGNLPNSEREYFEEAKIQVWDISYLHSPTQRFESTPQTSQHCFPSRRLN